MSRAFEVIVLTPAALGDPGLAIAALRAKDFGVALNYTNFRD